MRRLIRLVFPVCAFASFVFIAVYILWMRSAFQQDFVYRLQPSVTRNGPGWESLGVASAGGRLMLSHQVAALRLVETRTVQARTGKWGVILPLIIVVLDHFSPAGR